MLRDADAGDVPRQGTGRDAVSAFDASIRDRATGGSSSSVNSATRWSRKSSTCTTSPSCSCRRARSRGSRHCCAGRTPPGASSRRRRSSRVAEDTGLIVPIGAWVIERGVPPAGPWRKAIPNGRTSTMAVNLSARQLRDPKLVPSRAQPRWRTRSFPTVAVPRADRELAHGEAGGGRGAARPASRLGVRHLDRRLRHRLLVAGVPCGACRSTGSRSTSPSSTGLDRDTSDESLVAAIVAMTKRATGNHGRRGSRDPRPEQTSPRARLRRRPGLPLSRGRSRRPRPSRRRQLGVARRSHLKIVPDTDLA